MARLRVHVCIDQELTDSGRSGLVGTWSMLAAQLVRHPELDVTIHGVGAQERVTVVGGSVRTVEHPIGVVATTALARLGTEMPVRAGLLPYHRRLARALADADVIHSTSTILSFAMTALRVARHRRVPLVTSLQTDVPRYAQSYVQRMAERALGPLAALIHPDGVGRWARRLLQRQALWYLRRCACVLASDPSHMASLSTHLAPECLHYLARGIDTDTFNPTFRDRAWLARTLGIDPATPVVLFVGRLVPEKGVLTLARALRALAATGERFKLVACGEGEMQGEIERLLGARAILPGFQPHERLAQLYACADVFAFPSPTEAYANVVVEAMSAALPVVVSARGGARQHIDRPGENGVIAASDEPEVWAETLRGLLHDPAQRERLGAAARRRVETQYRTWQALCDEVVVPIWRTAARERECGPLPRTPVRASTLPPRPVEREGERPITNGATRSPIDV